MKILIVTPTVFKYPIRGYAGIEYLTQELALGLVKRGHSVDMTAPLGSKLEGVNMIEISEPSKNVNYEREQFEVLKDMSLDGYDVIHDNTHGAWMYLHPDIDDLPFCWTLHNALHFRNYAPCKYMNIISISDNQKESLANAGFDSRRVYNGIKLDNYTYREEKNDRLLFFSRFDIPKGAHTSINIAHKLKMPIDVAGTEFVPSPPYLAHIKRMCKSYPDVNYLGEVSFDMRRELFSRSKVLLFPLYHCIPDDETIDTIDGCKKIQDVKIGDLVFSNDGQFHPITHKVSMNYNGDLIKIYPHYGIPIMITPNHKIKYYRKETDDRRWIMADSLREGDYIQTPNMKFAGCDLEYIKLSDFLDMKNVKVKDGMMQKYKYNPNTKMRKYGKPLREIVDISEDFLHFCALYISEGCTTKDCISLAIGKKEYKSYIIKWIEEYFEVHANVKDKGSWYRVQIYSRKLSSIFGDMFGRGAYNKKVPRWMFSLSRRQLFQFMYYMINYDGCVNIDGNCSYSTASKTLAIQLGHLYPFTHISPSKGFYHGGYNIFFPINIKKFMYKQDTLSQIRKIERIPYCGRVWDITVEDSHNFTMSRVLVANSEPFGLVVLEANISGTPVITRNRAAMNELIKSGETGYICETDKEMMCAVKYIDEIDPKLCRKNAEKFSSEVMIENYISVYQSIIKGDRW